VRGASFFKLVLGSPNSRLLIHSCSRWPLRAEPVRSSWRNTFPNPTVSAARYVVPLVLSPGPRFYRSICFDIYVLFEMNISPSFREHLPRAVVPNHFLYFFLSPAYPCAFGSSHIFPLRGGYHSPASATSSVAATLSFFTVISPAPPPEIIRGSSSSTWSKRIALFSLSLGRDQPLGFCSRVCQASRCLPVFLFLAVSNPPVLFATVDYDNFTQMTDASSGP